MKGTVVVKHADLKSCLGLETILEKNSESWEKSTDECLFHAKEGALMTMICAMLDQNMPYTLQLENKSTNVNPRQSELAAKTLFN